MDQPQPQVPLQPQATPPIPPPQSVNPVSPIQESPRKSRSLKKVFLIFLIFMVLILGTGSLAAAVAYEKINIGNADLQGKISKFVQRLPLTPKTPKFIFESSMEAHEKVTSQNFAISIAAQSDDPSLNQLGFSKIDFQIKGDLDYADTNNLKASVDIQASVTSPVPMHFDASLRKSDPIVYFKVNKVPELIYSFLPQEQAAKLSTIFENWISYDTTTLDTQARRRLDETSGEDNSYQEAQEKFLQLHSDDRITKAIKLTSENLEDNTPTYKFSFAPDSETLDYFFKRAAEISAEPIDQSLGTSEKASDTIQDFVVDVWVSKKDYFLRQMVMSFKIKTPNSISTSPDALFPVPSSQSSTSISFAMEGSNFGKAVVVETPESAITIEEFIRLINEATQSPPPSDTTSPEAALL